MSRADTESRGIWLLIIPEARMAPTALVETLTEEDRELACIVGAGKYHRTMRK